jgi:hypothetical protein
VAKGGIMAKEGSAIDFTGVEMDAISARETHQNRKHHTFALLDVKGGSAF